MDKKRFEQYKKMMRFFAITLVVCQVLFAGKNDFSLHTGLNDL